MLTRLNKILIGALVVQLVLVVFVATRGEQAKLVEHPILAGFDSAAVTRVQVFGATEKQKIDLVKRGADWTIATAYDYPADASKVTLLLTPLAKMAAAEPVATSATRHKQLRVADGEFERKLVLTAGGKDTVIYIGSNAGLRRTAVRVGTEEDVYGVSGISTSTMGVEPREWVKVNYYDVPRDEITKVTVVRGTSKLEFERVPPAADLGSGSGGVPPPPQFDEWKATIDGAPIQLATGETIDRFAIETVISNVATISAKPADPKREASTPTATITVDRKGGSDVFDVIASDEYYWVKQRNSTRATLVDKERLEPAVTVSRDKLVTKPTPQAPGPGSGTVRPGAEPSGSAGVPPPPAPKK